MIPYIKPVRFVLHCTVRIKTLVSCCAVALLRWPNIWVEIAVLLNTRFWARNFLRPCFSL